MISALGRAFEDALAPAQRRVLLLSLMIACVLFALLWLGASLLLHRAGLTGIGFVDTGIEVLGQFAILFLAWLLFPAATTIVLGLFLDGVLLSIERRRYPGLGPPRNIPVAQVLLGGLRLAGLTVLINLLILPFYVLLPAINLVLFYGVNGYLLGREYFELVALRRLDRQTARTAWHINRLRLWAAGATIAALFSIPVVNLAAPLLGAAFMLHLFERIRRGADPASRTFNAMS